MTNERPPAPIGLKLLKTSVTAIGLIDLVQDRPATPTFVSIPSSAGGERWSELRQLQNVTTHHSDDGPFVRIDFDDRPSIDYPYDTEIVVVLAEPTNS
jgi:hypothetical protein